MKRYTYTVEELRTWRNSAGITQEQMAEAMGVTRNGYQKLEDMRDYVLLPRQSLVFEQVSLRTALERSDEALALPAVSAMCENFVRMVKKNRMLR